jgi:hypothetical protein
MAKPRNQPTRFDRELRGPEITVGGHTIQPVARMTGQQSSGGNSTSVWGYASVRVTPDGVIVRQADGAEQRVQVTDPTRAAIQSMAMTAGAIAALCMAIMLIVRIVRGRG